MTAIREIVGTWDAARLIEKLADNWKFDPHLCPTGRPIQSSNDAAYWVVVNGTVEDVADLNPFVELPRDAKPPEGEAGLLSSAVDFVEIKPSDVPGAWHEQFPPSEGWKVFKALKGLLQLYKIPLPPEQGEDILAVLPGIQAAEPLTMACKLCNGEGQTGEPGAVTVCGACEGTGQVPFKIEG